jgi:hypothetical protein
MRRTVYGTRQNPRFDVPSYFYPLVTNPFTALSQQWLSENSIAFGMLFAGKESTRREPSLSYLA